MSKSKVHSSKNNGSKNHRNGIKKPTRNAKVSAKGMNQKYIHNVHYTRTGRVAKLAEKK